jgi:Flp pilus assembly protein TadG
MTRSESGSALVELTWLGLLLLIPLVYVVLAVSTVQRSAYGATEAARSAARAYVLSPDVSTARSRAIAAARLAMSDQGVRLDASDVHISCAPNAGSCLQPGSTVEVTLDLKVELPFVPTVLGRQPAAVAVEASHVEAFGTYREGAE